MSVSFATREDWLAERLKGVGASEAAAAVGVCPYRTPVDLWQEKLGLTAPKPMNEAMAWGLKLEPLLIREYTELTGREVTRQQEFLRHPVHPFITATIDGWAGDRLVEIKTCGSWAREWGEEGDQIPEPYLIQVSQQMAVTGAALADVAVLIGGQRFRVFTVERNDALLNRVEDRVCEFWRHVEGREPPTWGRMTPQSLAAINPDCDGAMDADDALAKLVSMYEHAKQHADGFRDDADALKVKILERMGRHQFLVLPDGRRIKRHLVTVAAQTRAHPEHVRHYISFAKGPM